MKAGTAQSFLESSLTRAPLHDEAVVDDKDDKNDKDATGAGSCNCCCRCGRSRDWKQVGPWGTRRSKSHSSLRTGVAEITSWGWEPPKRALPASIETTKPCGPGEAPLERLPVEILGMVMQPSNCSESVLISSVTRSHHCSACSGSPPKQLLPSECRPHLLSAYFTNNTRSNGRDLVSSHYYSSFDHFFKVSWPSVREPGFGHHCQEAGLFPLYLHRSWANSTDELCNPEHDRKDIAPMSQTDPYCARSLTPGAS